jgi:SAM-dependent methyltransferase
MGISSANVALLMTALAQGARLGNAATLGMQTFWPSKKELDRLLKAFHYNHNSEYVFNRVGSSGSRFLEYLGADSVTEFDASGYEGAKVIHDMNIPLPSEWNGQFDFVYDGGCIEHIYDIAQVVRNIGNMIRPGGHLVISTTGNNLMGHGFYQFSPEFFYRVYSRANGWNTKLVLLAEHQLRPPRFWIVEDPEDLRSRIEIQTSTQVYTMIITEKLSASAAFHLPQQSDYYSAWSGHQHSHQYSSVLVKDAPRLPLGLNRLKVLINYFITQALSFIRNPLSRFSSSNISYTRGVRRLAIREMSKPLLNSLDR